MLKLKSALLVIVLSSGMLFGSNSALAASCACSMGQPCVCVQCECPGCN